MIRPKKRGAKPKKVKDSSGSEESDYDIFVNEKSASKGKTSTTKAKTTETKAKTSVPAKTSEAKNLKKQNSKKTTKSPVTGPSKAKKSGFASRK